MNERELDEKAYAESLDEPLDVRRLEPTIGSILQAFFDMGKRRQGPNQYETWDAWRAR